jgi:2-polyprenyl-3-methyl-5-hydroxy-6-metoxy-1,4-benzoquinol methylase
MFCPLCCSSKTELQIAVGTSEIASHWERVRGIDIRDEFAGISAVQLHKCTDCALLFFKPDAAAGSPALYEKLEKSEGYYQPRKWEHDAALDDLNGARNGLEVGCGFGAFVARVVEEKAIPFEGCEQNPSAVHVAESRGIPVRLETVEELAGRCRAKYDAVCSFQVLEHLVDPRGFLKSACELLRPGGKLILGVPNAESPISSFLRFFDCPPHHMTRWSENVLRNLARWFPLEVGRVAFEPLPDSKVELYVEAHEGVLREHGFGRVIGPRLRALAMRLIRKPRFRQFLKAETIYVCYVRK